MKRILTWREWGPAQNGEHTADRNKIYYTINKDKEIPGKFVLGISKGKNPFMPDYKYVEHAPEYDGVDIAKQVCEYHTYWFADRHARVEAAKADGITSISDVDLTNLDWQPSGVGNGMEAYDDLNYYEVHQPQSANGAYRLRVRDARRACVWESIPINFEKCIHAQVVGDWFSVWSNETLTERNRSYQSAA